MKGRFNEFGGQYVPETLMNALKELEDEFYKALDDKSFIDEYKYYLKDFVGRPSPLYFADNILTHNCKKNQKYLNSSINTPSNPQFKVSNSGSKKVTKREFS